MPLVGDGKGAGSATAAPSSNPKVCVSPELLGRVIAGRAFVRGFPFSVFECRRKALGCTVAGVPNMACLKARTAKTGAGVSGGSMYPVVSASACSMNCQTR